MRVSPMIEERHRVFAESLSKAERVLVLVRDTLCGGEWDELVEDLQARQSRKPFVLKLNTRIEDDLNRIVKLRTYEEEHGVDLRALLEGVQDAEEGISP